MATRFVFTPLDAEFPNTNFPQPLAIHSSARRPVLAFDAATEESCYFSAVLPQGWTGAITAIVKGVMAAATTGAVRLAIAVEANTALDALDLDTAESFDTDNAATSATVPGTAGHEFEVSITLTNHDSSAAGDAVRFRLKRVAADAADTATGDFYFRSLEIRDAA